MTFWNAVKLDYRRFRLWLSCEKDIWRYMTGIDKPVPKGRRATATFGNDYVSKVVTPEMFNMKSPDDV